MWTQSCQGSLYHDQLQRQGGSALNICPWRTLERIDIPKSQLTSSDLCVRGFDSSRRDIIGNLKTIISVGGVKFEVEFCVIDMQPSYNVILGRPWLYQAKAIASSLHQKLKFNHQGKTIVINGEPCSLVSASSSFVAHEVELNDFEVNVIEREGKLFSSPDF